MTTFNVKLNDKKQGELQLLIDGIEAGKMDISIKDDLLTVYHTEVNPEHEGKGYAKLLLDELIAYSESNLLKIIPLCPYVHLQFKRNPEKYNSIWHKAKA